MPYASGRVPCVPCVRGMGRIGHIGRCIRYQSGTSQVAGANSGADAGVLSPDGPAAVRLHGH
jgi:hypothetical protein